MQKRYTVLITIFVLSTILSSCAAKKQDNGAGSFNGVLFRSLFNGSSETFSLNDLNRQTYAALPDTLKTRLASYAERYTRFRSRLTPPEKIAGIAVSPADVAVFAKRQSLERGIFALVNMPEIEDSAAAYAVRAYLYHDWKIKSGSPYAEALFAEKQVNDPVLRPYLLLFLLHRYRCSYESFVKEQSIAAIQQCSQRYRELLQQARAYPDPLVGLIADDLDRYPKNINEQSMVTGGDVHP